MSRRRDEDSRPRSDAVSNPQGLSTDGVVSSASARIIDGPDTIAKAIKEEVLKKQFEIMRSWYVAQAESEAEKEKIAKYNEAQLRVHSNNPDLAAKAEKDTVLHAKLNQAEVQGYRKVNTKFQGQFSDLKWDDSSTPDSRVKEIKNANNEVIANLVEKNVKGPLNFPTLNGGVAKVENYRAVDFPLVLKGEGPMHLQMAVKDAQGNNIAADKAVYFTAHYDKQGKLEDFSHPQPIKFAGQGKDAIGYIERDGQIYTLPITRGKLNEMQIQLDTNRGLDVNRAAGRASDTVDIGTPDRPRTQTPQARTQQTTTPVQPTTGTQTTVQPTTGTQTPQARTQQTTTPVQSTTRTQTTVQPTTGTQTPQQQTVVQSTTPFVRGVLTEEQRSQQPKQVTRKDGVTKVETSPMVGDSVVSKQTSTQAPLKQNPKSQTEVATKAQEIRSRLVQDLAKTGKQSGQEASKSLSDLDKSAEKPKPKPQLQRRNSTGSMGMGGK